MMQIVAATGTNFFHQLSMENQNVEELARVAFVEVPSAEVDLQNQKDSPIIDVACTNSYNVIVKGNGTLHEWGTLESTPIPEPRRILFETNVNIVSVACGRKHVLALSTDGEVFSWGLGLLGRLGHGSEKSTSRPKLISAFRHAGNNRSRGFKSSRRRVWPIAVGCGAAHSGVIMNDNSVYLWGANRYSQCGGDPSRGKFLPTLLQSPATDNVSVVKFEGGRHHSVLMSENGLLFAWGAATGGRLGIEYSGPISRYPRRVPIGQGDLVKSFACGDFHTLALTRTGGVFSWGVNKDGQCGVGHFLTVRRATQVIGLEPPHVSVSSVAAGANHSLAIGRNGSVYTWGLGEGGLGLGGFALPPSTIVSTTGSSGSRRSPQSVSGLDTELGGGPFRREIPLRVQAHILRSEGVGKVSPGSRVPPAAVPMLCSTVVGATGSQGQGHVVGGNLRLVRRTLAPRGFPLSSMASSGPSEGATRSSQDSPRDGLTPGVSTMVLIQSQPGGEEEDEELVPGTVDPRFVSHAEPVELPLPTGHHAVTIDGGGTHTVLLLKRDLTLSSKSRKVGSSGKSQGGSKDEEESKEGSKDDVEAEADLKSDDEAKRGNDVVETSTAGESEQADESSDQATSTPAAQERPILSKADSLKEDTRDDDVQSDPGTVRQHTLQSPHSEAATENDEPSKDDFVYQRAVEGLWIAEMSGSTEAGYAPGTEAVASGEESGVPTSREEDRTTEDVATYEKGGSEGGGGNGGGGGGGGGRGGGGGVGGVVTEGLSRGSSERFSPAVSDLHRILQSSPPPSRIRETTPASGVQWRASTRSDMQMLLQASRHGRFRVVEELLEAGCPTRARDTKGNTALIIAAQNNYPLVVDTLLSYQADPCAANNDGNTGLHFALRRGFVSVAQLLIQYGASETVKNKYGLTPHEGIVPEDLEKL